MRFASFLIKPASSSCNMRCEYCFYRDVASRRTKANNSRMSDETMRLVIDRALDIAPDAKLTFAFQGGEPTLAGLDFFQAFTSYVAEHLGGQTAHYALQTNGLAITPEWASFFREHDFLVGISVDAYRTLHDSIRRDLRLEPTHRRVMSSIAELRAAGVEYNVLTVLTSRLARHPQRTFNFIKDNGIEYVQLIPCLPSLDGSDTGLSLSPQEFFSFYRTFFDLWFREFRRGHYISVDLFDSIMDLSLGQPPTQCGALGHCAVQFVIESNGDVFPCDFYALDEWCCGNVRRDSFEDIARCETMRQFLIEDRRPCSMCSSCSFEMICNRNCKRLNVAYYDERYCGYRSLLEYVYEPLSWAAREIALRDASRVLHVDYHPAPFR